jgi:hypothetical protein
MRSVFSAVAGLLLVVPVLAHAGDPARSLTIVNKTRSNLLELYTSPASAEAWGADQLGSMRIGVGGNVKVSFNNVPDECMFDLMLIFSDGEKVVRREDVCASGTLVVTEHKEDLELPSI